jgi:hypothetical protein
LQQSQATYDSRAPTLQGDAEGLYDEPAFNQNSAKHNPIYQSQEDLAKADGCAYAPPCPRFVCASTGSLVSFLFSSARWFTFLDPLATHGADLDVAPGQHQAEDTGYLAAAQQAEDVGYLGGQPVGGEPVYDNGDAVQPE